MIRLVPMWCALSVLAACGAMTGVDDAGNTGGGTAATGGGTATGGGGGSDAGTGFDLCGYSHSGFNATASVNTTSTVAWTCTATTRSVASNGLPDHTVGVFPNANCPNTIAAYTVAASMPLAPVNTGTASSIAIVGYAYNGVKFDPGTAGSCSATSCSLAGNTGSWNIEALGQSSFNFGVDSSNAHVQPTGEYHYHGMPEEALTQLARGQAMTLVGYALDGFPVYARYGFTTPTDATSAVKVMTGSYRLKSTPDTGRPSTTTYPMGAFRQDYEYAAGSGDLDECNGRTGVTPEFPQGTYHYYITDTYPFIQRCVKGTATGGGMMQTDGGMGMNPPMCAAGQTMMCCGDGVCGGPETHTNCAADCP